MLVCSSPLVFPVAIFHRRSSLCFLFWVSAPVSGFPCSRSSLDLQFSVSGAAATSQEQLVFVLRRLLERFRIRSPVFFATRTRFSVTAGHAFGLRAPPGSSLMRSHSRSGSHRPGLPAAESCPDVVLPVFPAAGQIRCWPFSSVKRRAAGDPRFSVSRFLAYSSDFSSHFGRRRCGARFSPSVSFSYAARLRLSSLEIFAAAGARFGRRPGSLSSCLLE
jgi:hypothetical protein